MFNKAPLKPVLVTPVQLTRSGGRGDGQVFESKFGTFSEALYLALNGQFEVKL